MKFPYFSSGRETRDVVSYKYSIPAIMGSLRPQFADGIIRGRGNVTASPISHLSFPFY